MDVGSRHCVKKKKKSSKSLTDHLSSIPRPVLLHDASSTHVAEIRVEGDDEIELGVLHDQDFLLNGHDLTYMFHQSNRTVYSTPALLFLKWKLGRTHYFHSLGQAQSTVAQRAETTMAECSLASYV